MSLAHLGFGPALAAEFEPYEETGLAPGRVAVEHRGALVLLTGEGEVWAGVPAQFVRSVR